MKYALLLAFSVLFATQAHAVFNEKYLENQPQWLESLVRDGLADVTDYQIGDIFGKTPVTRDSLKSESPAFNRAAAATARYGGATAFYLGKINGHHMMATNHHVMPDGRVCSSRSANFPVLGKSYHCEKFFGEWSAIDLALFSITVPPQDEELLAHVGRSFNFSRHPYAGEELITIGFGIWENPGRQMMANEDSDCKVFSAKDDYRFISDPDQINPADYQTWSMATGCDVSHGDSGSAMVDRQTGDVVGIIWTTATQKPERIRSSSYLAQVLRDQSADIWTWLSYAVPAPKIEEYLRQHLNEIGSGDPDTLQTIVAFLNAGN